MTKIFVALVRDDNDNTDFLGTYSTFEKAFNCCEKNSKDNDGIDQDESLEDYDGLSLDDNQTIYEDNNGDAFIIIESTLDHE